MENPEQKMVNGSSPESLSPERSNDLEGAYLARTRSGEALNPQPADDPADPLNWPLSLKVSAKAMPRVVKQGLTGNRLAS